MNEDKNAEQLRACRDAFEREYRCEGASFRKTNGDYTGPLNTFWEVWQTAWRANTRADSGEAVAFDGPEDDRSMLLYLMQAFDTESWQCPQCGKDEECATMDSAYLLREYLKAKPRAMSADVRYVTVKHPRFFNEEENNAWHRALPDLMAAFDAIAAIASREGK